MKKILFWRSFAINSVFCCVSSFNKDFGKDSSYWLHSAGFNMPGKLFSNSEFCQEFSWKNGANNRREEAVWDGFDICDLLTIFCSVWIAEKCVWFTKSIRGVILTTIACSIVLMTWHLFQLSSNMFSSRLMIHRCVTANWPNEFKLKRKQLWGTQRTVGWNTACWVWLADKLSLL